MTPCTASAADLEGWSEKPGAAIRLADLWSRYIPRGKGWGPRVIGRNFAQRDRWVIRTWHGMRMAVEPASLDAYLYTRRQGGCMDETILHACRSLLRRGDVFWDIGANIGYFALEIAGLFSGSIEVVAIEPQPDLAQAIAISSELNGLINLAVYDVLLGSEVKPIELHIPSHSTQASVISREEGARVIACQGLTVDAVVERGVAQPSLIKLDVEGFELEVLRGARKTMAHHYPLIILESDVNMHRFGYGRTDLFALADSTGPHRFYFVTDRGFLPVEPEKRNDLSFSDLLFCPDRPELRARVEEAHAQLRVLAPMTPRAAYRRG